MLYLGLPLAALVGLLICLWLPCKYSFFGHAALPGTYDDRWHHMFTNLQVSAVSPKTNTTEHTRLGAFTYGTSQVVLYDTPGVVGPE